MFLIILFREKSVNMCYVHIYGLLMTSEYVQSFTEMLIVYLSKKSVICLFQKINPRNTEVFNER